MPLIGDKELKKRLRKIKVDANKKLIAIYTQGLKNIVAPSPVHFKDGGSFKNGWFLSVGVPFSLKAGRDEDRAGSGSYASIETMPKWILNKKIYYTNNTPQANVIEYGGFTNPVKLGTNTSETKGEPNYQKLSANGFSRQAPNGVVRTELKKMKARIKKL
jgi:hypothetical protein